MFWRLPPIEDPLERWRREQIELEAKREREQALTARQLYEQRSKDWEAWAVAIIAREIERERGILLESIGQAIGHERKAYRALEARIAKLEARQHRGVDDAGVVDLPSPIVRKVRINAA